MQGSNSRLSGLHAPPVMLPCHWNTLRWMLPCPKWMLLKLNAAAMQRMVTVKAIDANKLRKCALSSSTSRAGGICSFVSFNSLHANVQLWNVCSNGASHNSHMTKRKAVAKPDHHCLQPTLCSGSSDNDHSKGNSSRKKAATGGLDEHERKHLALQASAYIAASEAIGLDTLQIIRIASP
eukprot:286620-Pelagomonas_calceolata.AAC.12